MREGEDGELAREDWDEMCLACNIWIPVGEPPGGDIRRGGKSWPVLVFFHGGFLQFGSPNGSDYIGLMRSVSLLPTVFPRFTVRPHADTLNLHLPSTMRSHSYANQILVFRLKRQENVSSSSQDTE